jgi:transcriptional regulator with XRE-family HTH domain
MIRLGAVVRFFRRQLDISQEELAWRANMHQTYLSDIERGIRNISVARLVELVSALNVSLKEFFASFEERTPRSGDIELPASTRGYGKRSTR